MPFSGFPTSEWLSRNSFSVRVGVTLENRYLIGFPPVGEDSLTCL
jgi:hypothetical protein